MLAIGATAGTLGVGGEVSALVYDTVVVRAAASYIALNLGDNETSNSGKGKYDVQARFAGGMVDWHPFRSGWRMSTGLRYADVDLSATNSLSNGSSVRIGNNSYNAAQVGQLKTAIKNHNMAAPYIGFGYDSAHFNRDGVGLSLGMDIGALYIGDADVKLSTTKSVAGLAADIAVETDKTKSDIKKYYNFYPVFMLAAKISF